MIELAIVGATGLVGREMLALVCERRLPLRSLRLFASARSAGAELRGAARPVVVEDVMRSSLADIDVALFSAGAAAARQLAPRFVEQGAVVIDNSSAFRDEPDKPLVVPEVNGDDLGRHKGLIANPNCSTIQLVMVLKPLATAFGLRRVTVATYQSVSGQGQKGVAALAAELAAEDGAVPPAATAAPVFAHPIAHEALPHCGELDAEGWSSEERKLMHETRRILGLPELAISATAVRVPVWRSHSEAVWVETVTPVDVAGARRALAAAPGVELVDDPAAARYPLARQAAGGDRVLVGRVRRDPSVERGLLLWVVADNVRKGAALNAVQILEELLARGLVGASAGADARR